MGTISATFISLIVGAIAKFHMPEYPGWLEYHNLSCPRYVPTNESAMPTTDGLSRTGEPAGFGKSIVGAMTFLLLYRLAWFSRAIA